MRGMRSSALLPHSDPARAPARVSHGILRLRRLFGDVYRSLQIYPERTVRRRQIRLVDLRMPRRISFQREHRIPERVVAAIDAATSQIIPYDFGWCAGF